MYILNCNFNESSHIGIPILNNMYKRKALSTCFRLNDGSDMFTHEEEEDDF